MSAFIEGFLDEIEKIAWGQYRIDPRVSRESHVTMEEKVKGVPTGRMVRIKDPNYKPERKGMLKTVGGIFTQPVGTSVVKAKPKPTDKPPVDWAARLSKFKWPAIVGAAGGIGLKKGYDAVRGLQQSIEDARAGRTAV